MNKFFLHDRYLSRSDPIFFDDTSYTDEWQNEVYALARDIFTKNELKKVADFGCGSGYKLIKFFSEFDTIGFDFQPTVEFLRRTYPNRKWSDVPLDFGIFGDADMIIASDVIEHLLNPLHLMSILKSSPARFIIISTPALDILADRGDSPRYGPPANAAHAQEWSTGEFARLVAGFLKVSAHLVINVPQATQVVVCERFTEGFGAK